jgi:hypothetical protein
LIRTFVTDICHFGVTFVHLRLNNLFSSISSFQKRKELSFFMRRVPFKGSNLRCEVGQPPQKSHQEMVTFLTSQLLPAKVADSAENPPHLPRIRASGTLFQSGDERRFITLLTVRSLRKTPSDGQMKASGFAK